MSEIYLLDNKQNVLGPYTISAINELIKDLKLSTESLACLVGEKEWKPLKSACFLNLGIFFESTKMPPPIPETNKTNRNNTDSTRNEYRRETISSLEAFLKSTIALVARYGPSTFKKVLFWAKSNPKKTIALVASYLVFLCISLFVGFSYLKTIDFSNLNIYSKTEKTTESIDNSDAVSTHNSDGNSISDFVGWYKGTAETDELDGNAFLKIFENSNAELRVYFYEEFLGETIVTKEFTCDGKFYLDDDDWYFKNYYDGKVYEVDFSSSVIEMEGDDIEFEFERE